MAAHDAPGYGTGDTELSLPKSSSKAAILKGGQPSSFRA